LRSQAQSDALDANTFTQADMNGSAGIRERWIAEVRAAEAAAAAAAEARAERRAFAATVAATTAAAAPAAAAAAAASALAAAAAAAAAAGRVDLDNLPRTATGDTAHWLSQQPSIADEL
jgi:hypothetical protein